MAFLAPVRLSEIRHRLKVLFEVCLRPRCCHAWTLRPRRHLEPQQRSPEPQQRYPSKKRTVFSFRYCRVELLTVFRRDTQTQLSDSTDHGPRTEHAAPKRRAFKVHIVCGLVLWSLVLTGSWRVVVGVDYRRTVHRRRRQTLSLTCRRCRRCTLFSERIENKTYTLYSGT